ncbi:MAG: methyltransferase domain-containing protein [Candidatus Poribacteria bacterium]|nr:methyltransferase domain-containing protein [Candidatus Poribacteria bacterium]MDE0506572.1 methyltransferase domain-containing protein [Candidatus Poribacteria bacterium]
MNLASASLTTDQFARIDESADSLFYSVPRIVAHIDDNGIKSIKAFLEHHLPRNKTILDLMSSAYSHLPDEFPCPRVVGLGLNEVELRSNRVLDEYVIHDLNAEPRLPFFDSEFSAVILTASVQYLTKPVNVFREVQRVLQPSGPFIVIFSNRMFAEKAVAVWRFSSDEGRIELVTHYLHQAGGFHAISFVDKTPDVDESTDPIYIVMAIKQP